MVEGSVSNKLTGSPVKGAHVIYTRLAAGPAQASSPISSDTDPQGRFHLDLSPGSYRLWVERHGFVRQSYGSHAPDGPSSVLSVIPGEELHDIAFRMTPLGAISGRVMDEDGEPVQGVGVQVLRMSYSSGLPQLTFVGGSTSNDLGEYRCFELPAGRYFILAAPNGSPLSHPVEQGALVPEVQDAYIPIYYPGAAEFDAATSVALPEGGDVSDINISLQRIRATSIRGRLLSPRKLLPNEFQVILASNEHGTASFVGRTPAVVDPTTGRFEITGVAPGSYILVASQFTSGQVFSARVPIEIRAGIPPEQVTLALTPSAQLAGNVSMEDGSVLPPGLALHLFPLEGIFPGLRPESKVGPDGSIRLAGVSPGSWALSVQHLPEGFWIKSVALGDAQMPDGMLNLQSGSAGPLSIVLARDGAAVSGTVEANGQPHAATVVLAPLAADRRSPQSYRSVSVSGGGSFSLKGVPPGKYRLFAFESVVRDATLDPEVLSDVKDMGQTVSLAAGETATLRLTLIPYEATLPSR
ncbi:MAG TPA: carboxypeptidase-like regulatory domain-containing protein [Candidatus Angelobacter sp.]|nr:carboxypeptidase-like regulatory domain-containing protein [Candidatus Angelobacter sp.]